MTTIGPPCDLEAALRLAALLELSAERDHWIRRCLASWREGWRAAEAVLSGRYSEGYYDGTMARKHAQHQIAAQVRLELARWDGRREDFGRPRPRDYPGGPVGWDGGPADPDPELRVWLGGPPVHWHRCTDACRVIDPRHPYTPAEAAAILATLPGGYSEHVRQLLAGRERPAA